MAAMSGTTKQILEYASITHLKCRIGRLNRCETDKKKFFYGTKETYGVLIGQKSIVHCAGNPEFKEIYRTFYWFTGAVTHFADRSESLLITRLRLVINKFFLLPLIIPRGLLRQWTDRKCDLLFKYLRNHETFTREKATLVLQLISKIGEKNESSIISFLILGGHIKEKHSVDGCDGNFIVFISFLKVNKNYLRLEISFFFYMHLLQWRVCDRRDCLLSFLLFPR